MYELVPARTPIVDLQLRVYRLWGTPRQIRICIGSTNRALYGVGGVWHKHQLDVWVRIAGGLTPELVRERIKESERSEQIYILFVGFKCPYGASLALVALLLWKSSADFVEHGI